MKWTANVINYNIVRKKYCVLSINSLLELKFYFFYLTQTLSLCTYQTTLIIFGSIVLHTQGKQ